MRLRSGLTLLVLVPVGAAALLLVWCPPQRRTAESVAAKAGPHAPSIFCEFYDFMHKTVVASFDFAVEAGNPSRLPLRAEVLPDGTDVVHGEGERPRWSYRVEDGTPTAVAPDGETRILFYGLRPEKGGMAWSEAGVRNTSTRNLEGRCRQALLDKTTLGVVATFHEHEETQR